MDGTTGPISLDRLADKLLEPWKPQDVVAVNDAILRMARLHGEFPWHAHDEDEMFLCWRGSFRIQMDERDPVTLEPGDLFVVPRGVLHRPVAAEPAHAIMLERPETLQYGNPATD
ncbi:MAG TPA: cupin domain-containing protein [Actinomycetota bacterium]